MPTKERHDEAEGAVRAYLEYLENPNSMQDVARIAKLESELESTGDPIDKLKLLAELHRAKAVDPEPYIQGFVRHAQAYAEGEGIPLSVFRELRPVPVPDEVLAAAGFPVGRRRGRRRSGGGGGAGAGGGTSGGTRARSVSGEQIKLAVAGRKEPFTISDIRESVGGSPMTVRKAIEDLLASGKLEKLGPMQGYQGKGRAPTVYATVG